MLYVLYSFFDNYCVCICVFCKNRRPYNLYCVGADVKPCSVNQSTHRLATILHVTDDDRRQTATDRRNTVPTARPLVRSAKTRE